MAATPEPPPGTGLAPEPPVHLGMPRPGLVDDGRLRAGNASRGGLVAREVRLLRSRLGRLRQAFARRLGRQGALFLAPAPAVHAWGRRRPLRVLFLDAGNRVLEVDTLAPWTARPAPRGTRAALLLRGDNPVQVRAGDRIEWLRPQPRLEDRAEWLAPGEPPA